MQPINEMRMDFSAKSNNESFARVVAAAFVSQLDPTLDELEDVKTAVSEAVTNSIIHGYENNGGIVGMHLKLYENSAEITIIDKGKGMEDIEAAKQPLYTSKPEMERAGMGFTIMENFMDKILIYSEVGIGTTVTMFKTFQSVGCT